LAPIRNALRGTAARRMPHSTRRQWFAIDFD
jgi:hypothetical protein